MRSESFFFNVGEDRYSMRGQWLDKQCVDAWLCKMRKNGKQMGRREEVEMGNGSVEDR